MADKIVEQEDEGRYGFGTEPAFKAFLKRIGEKKIQSQIVLAVNIDTLVRNTAESKLTVSEITNKVCNYMHNIASDMTNLVGTWQTERHYVIFYHCELRSVPPLFRRFHNSETSLKANEALTKVLDRLETAKRQTNGNVTAIVASSKEMKQPSYKGIVQLVNGLAASSTPIHMISHNPIDYHIQRLGRIGILYRSYTGTVVEMSPTKLGGIVFDEKGVPFYPITHVLLGDKSVIKGLLVKQDRKNFHDLCIRERFALRSENYINTSSKINRKLIPYRLD